MGRGCLAGRNEVRAGTARLRRRALLQEIEESGKAEDAAGGAERGLAGDLGLHEVGSGLGGYRGARKKISALIGGVAKANQLRLEALDFAGDGLAIGRAKSAIGAFRADGDGASQHLNDAAERGIGNLKPGAERAEILQK